MKKRYLIIAIIILSFISIFVGVNDISIKDIVTLNPEKLNILFISRLPRLIGILVAGVGLSISGLIMQQISRNKFISPTTAATTDFAKFGVLFSLMVFTTASPLKKMLCAFAFALAGTFLFMKIVKRIRHKDIIFVPLVGMMLGGVVDSVTTFFAYKNDLLQNVSSFMQGDFSLILKGNYELLYLSIPLVIIGFIYASRFTIAGMGEDFAANIGVDYNKIVNVGLAIVALISSVVIITIGDIPFLGLIIPNIVSMYKGDNIKDSIGHTALLGVAFLLVCDIFGRLIIFPYEVSISLTVGVVGSIIFLTMIMRRYKNEA